MKRSLLFAAIAAVAFSSCSKDDAISINETSKGIGFGVLNNKVQSRATETTVDNIGNFSVYAYNFADGSTVDYTTASPYYNNVTINVASGGVCTYNNNAEQKMWPTGKLNFLAYSPANYASYNKGTVSVDMSAKLSARLQQDLVVAQKLNQTRVDKVPMTFNHAMSQIKFRAASKYATVEFLVKSIKITGVNTKGNADLTTWTLTTPNGATNIGNGLAWTASDAATVVFGTKTEEKINTTGTAVDLTAISGALMVIPQTLKGGDPVSATNTVTQILADMTHSYIVIEYSATDKETGAVLVTNGRCAAPVSTDLKAGLRYTYTMILAGSGDGSASEDKLYPIDFTCTVEGWVDGPTNIGGEI